MYKLLPWGQNSESVVPSVPEEHSDLVREKKIQTAFKMILLRKVLPTSIDRFAQNFPKEV